MQLMREPRVPDNVVGWLFRVVRNGAVTQRGRTHGIPAMNRPRRRRQPWFATNQDDAIDAAAATRAWHHCHSNCEAIVLRLWGGQSFEQIAELTDTSTSTAHRRYVAGLTALREKELPCTVQTNPKK